jgi:pyridoxamine 5'-phosphate oxidase
MPEATTSASATSDAVPSARLVVLRGLWRGLVFFTDYKSDKGAELAANLRGAVLHWLVPAHRQVCVRGRLSGQARMKPTSTGAHAHPPSASARPPRTKAVLSPAGRSWEMQVQDMQWRHPAGTGEHVERVG